jgi:hypothetical protein
MEYTPERAVTVTLEIYEGSSAESMAWHIISSVGRSFSPVEYMPFVPAPVQEALRLRSTSPPKSIDDLLYAESSIYSSKFFEGLTPEEGEEKVRQAERASKQEKVDAIRALHAYFASA